MIKLYKHFIYSWQIDFDRQGGEELIGALQSALSNEEKVLKINYLDKKGERIIDLVFINDEITYNVVLTKSKLSIEMDREEIEDAIERFGESIEIKYFYPAEFYQGKMGKNTISITAAYKE